MNQIKTLIYCGINDLVNFSKLRPQFDVCYGFDANPDKVEQAKKVYKNDPNVHIVFGALTERGGEEIEFNVTDKWDPSSTLGTFNPEYGHIKTGLLVPQTKIKVPAINLYEYCLRNGIEEIDTLITDLQGMDCTVLKTLEPLIQKGKIQEIQCEVETDGTPSIHLNLPSNKFSEFRKLLSVNYEILWRDPEVVPEGWWEMDVRWKLRRNGANSQTQAHMEEYQSFRTDNTLDIDRYMINIVYGDLPPEHHINLHHDKVSVVWSSLPLAGCGVHAYLDANSFRGRLPGRNVLIMLEPVVVLPGEYSDEIWQHFDHVLTLCDALVERDEKFVKLRYPRAHWVSNLPITENIMERERNYPTEGRRQAICIINGYKKSSVPSELYSKRFEAGSWFNTHSNIPFDIYGNPPFPLSNFKGILAPDAKLNTLKQYAYCLCFENTDHPALSRGYVTEKVLDCLETRTIPIYLGAANIEKYIPRECFIDFRQFKDYAELNTFLENITPSRYREYIHHIDTWVSQGGLRPYSCFAMYNRLAEMCVIPQPEEISSQSVKTTDWEQGFSPVADQKDLVPIADAQLWSREQLTSAKSPLINYAAPPQDTQLCSNKQVDEAKQLFKEKKYEEALSRIRVELSHGGGAEAHYLHALLLSATVGQEACIAELQTTVGIDPNHADALTDLGYIYAQRGDHIRALENFKKAIMANEKHYNAIRNMIILLINTGRTQDALATLKGLLTRMPDDPELLSLAKECIALLQQNNEPEVMLDGNGERVDIKYLDTISYDALDMYQKSHYRRYEFARGLLDPGDFCGDFACGTGYGSVMLAERAVKVIGADLNGEVIKVIRRRYEHIKNVDFIQGNLLDLKLVSFFNTIVSFETIEHLAEKDIPCLFDIFARALKPNGTFIFSVPYMQERSDVAVKMGFHLTFYINEMKLEAWLTQAGFKVVQYQYQNYETHTVQGRLNKKDFIICVAQKQHT